MKTYGLLSAGNVQLHFIAVSPAAVPPPITPTAALISFAGWEGFFGAGALARPPERRGCKGNRVGALSAVAALKDAPSGAVPPRPPWRLKPCLAGLGRGGGRQALPAGSSSPGAGCSVCGAARSAAPGSIYVPCLYGVRFNKALLLYPRTGQTLSHYYRQNIA